MPAIRQDIDINVNDRQSLAALGKLDKGFDGIRGSAQRLSGAVKGMFPSGIAGALGIAGGIMGFKLLATSIVQASMNAELLRTKMNVLYQDAAKGGQAFDWAKKFADKTPFNTNAVINATAKLKGYGLETKKWIKLAGDFAIMGTRESPDANLTQAIEAIADAQTGEIERLKELGVTGKMLRTAGAKGGGGKPWELETIAPALEKIIKERYGGGTEKLAETLAGKMSNLTSAVENLKVALGDDLKPTIEKLTAVLTGLAEWAGTPGGKTAIETGAVVAGGIGAAYAGRKLLGAAKYAFKGDAKGAIAEGLGGAGVGGMQVWVMNWPAGFGVGGGAGGGGLGGTAGEAGAEKALEKRAGKSAVREGAELGGGIAGERVAEKGIKGFLKRRGLRSLAGKAGKTLIQAAKYAPEVALGIEGLGATGVTSGGWAAAADAAYTATGIEAGAAGAGAGLTGAAGIGAAAAIPAATFIGGVELAAGRGGRQALHEGFRSLWSGGTELTTEEQAAEDLEASTARLNDERRFMRTHGGMTRKKWQNRGKREQEQKARILGESQNFYYRTLEQGAAAGTLGPTQMKTLMGMREQFAAADREKALGLLEAGGIGGKGEAKQQEAGVEQLMWYSQQQRLGMGGGGRGGRGMQGGLGGKRAYIQTQQDREMEALDARLDYLGYTDDFIGRGRGARGMQGGAGGGGGTDSTVYVKFDATDPKLLEALLKDPANREVMRKAFIQMTQQDRALPAFG